MQRSVRLVYGAEWSLSVYREGGWGLSQLIPGIGWVVADADDDDAPPFDCDKLAADIRARLWPNG